MNSRFQKAKSFRSSHDNGDHFIITYDYAAGKKNRYTVIVWKLGKAKIIGQELQLGFAKKVVACYPNKVK
jgi:hypothetical protein